MCQNPPSPQRLAWACLPDGAVALWLLITGHGNPRPLGPRVPAFQGQVLGSQDDAQWAPDVDPRCGCKCSRRTSRTRNRDDDTPTTSPRVNLSSSHPANTAPCSSASGSCLSPPSGTQLQAHTQGHVSGAHTYKSPHIEGRPTDRNPGRRPRRQVDKARQTGRQDMWMQGGIRTQEGLRRQRLGAGAQSGEGQRAPREGKWPGLGEEAACGCSASEGHHSETINVHSIHMTRVQGIEKSPKERDGAPAGAPRRTC